MTYLITYLLSLFDLYMTSLWVKRYGLSIEANPIGRWLIQSGSVYFVKIVVMAVALFLLYVCTQQVPKWKWIRWIPFALYFLLAIYHLYIASIIF